MSVYKEDFPKDSVVRIRSSEELQKFMRPAWKYHHPVSVVMLKHAGTTARVVGVGFYHGGDPLYTLDGLPGLWHEECLSEPVPPSTKID